MPANALAAGVAAGGPGLLPNLLALAATPAGQVPNQRLLLAPSESTGAATLWPSRPGAHGVHCLALL